MRSLSVRALSLEIEADGAQLSLFADENRRQRQMDLERAVDGIRGRYGYTSIRRGIMLTDPALDLDAKGGNIIHPIGFLGTL